MGGSMDFSQIKAVISDMDGVLWRSDTPLPGLHDFFAWVRQHDLPFALATNNSSKLPQQYVEKLAKMGVDDVQPHQIVTSGTATASYLQTRYAPGTRIHVVGMDGLRQMIRDAGFMVADDDVQAVVAGIDFDLTYDTARRATHLIRGGADYIGTNGDLTFPTPEGLVPGAGSLLAMLTAATDVQPVVIGKPERAMFEAALRTLGTPPEATLMIGDRLNTDIQGAVALGLKTAIVLTGVNSRDDIEASDIKPDAVYDDLAALVQAATTN